MVNKKAAMIWAALFLVVALSFFVSSAEVCCEKTISGAWCQLAEETECAGGYSTAPTSCDQTTFCQVGTCVNENSGVCTPNTPKAVCEDQGGVWDSKSKDEISQCKPGCCILGQEVAFVNEASCKQLATDYGVNVNFRADITSQSECFALDTTEDEGACVLESETGTDCKKTTKSGCGALDGVFHKDLLCSAVGLSDCAKSKETKLFEDKVYFSDTCGNLANIYDETKYDDLNYWEEIQDAECSVGSNPSSSCGACSYRLGTIGAEYKAGEPGMPKKAPKYGDYVCKELACFYDTNDDGKIESSEKYSHGESWCAESPGTYLHIPLDIDNATKQKLAEGYDEYNLPGSRYYKLKCYDGEVIVEPCKEFRNSVCKEGVDLISSKRKSACFPNSGVSCLTNYPTKDSCNVNLDCKWVPGYTSDGHPIDYDSLEVSKLEKYEQEQGVCLPIFSEGTSFWNGDGEAMCGKLSTIEDRALFETGIGEQRKNFANDSIKEAANKCIDGCYAIPGYGSTDGTDYTDPKEVQEFELGSGNLGISVQNGIFSKREGYYCKDKADKPDEIDNWKTGPQKGNTMDCGTNDLEKRRVHIFYTHEQWLNTIRERSRSLSDCGYKPHAFYDDTKWSGDSDSEQLTAIFQILKQDQKVKKLVGEKTTIYKGNDPTPNAGYRNSEEIWG